MRKLFFVVSIAVILSGFSMRWSEGTELFEYVCQDNNHFPETVLGTEGPDLPFSPIAP